MKQVAERQAWYLTRLRWNTHIYTKTEEGTYIRFNVEGYTNSMKEGKTLEFPQVYVGSKEKYETRLILYRLTETEYKKREGKKKNVPKRQRRMLATNLLTDQGTAQELYQLYSLRWQIEIIFKTWKSIFNIHEVKNVKIERFQCHLYGRFIALFLTAVLTFHARKLLWNKKKVEVSEYTSAYIIREHFHAIRNVLFHPCENLGTVLETVYIAILTNGRKARKRTQSTPFEILGLTQKYTNELHEVA